MNFRDRIISNLINYKKDILKISESGTYKNKKYDHILPIDKIEKNLLNTDYLNELINTFYSLKINKKIHKYFHHLNSSQALAINLFVPIIKENLYSAFLNSKKFIDVYSEFEHIESTSFEKQRKTNFDFFIKTKNEKYFFEIKYSEENFGSSSNDESHKNKYQNIYLPILTDICISPVDKEQFLKNYQLWRNLCHVIYGNVCFVIPAFREDLIKKINNSTQLLKSTYQNKIKIIIFDDFILKIINCSNINISNHYKEFKKKYLEI